MKILSFVLLTFVLSGIVHGEPLKVSIDCYMNDDLPVNCKVLEQIYFSLPIVQSVSSTEAELVIKIRNFPTETANVMRYSLTGKANLPDIESEDEVRIEIQGDDFLSRASNTLVGLTTPYSHIKKFEVDGQSVNITVSSLDGTGASTSASEDKFYVAPGISGSFRSGQGTESFSVRTAVDGVYSTPKFKISTYEGIYYYNNVNETTAFIPGSSSSGYYQWASLRGVYTIKKRWSVALFTKVMTVDSIFSYEDENLNQDLDPLALKNRASFIEAKAGLEWILVPFQEDDSGNIAIRYLIGPEFHNYVDPESFKYLEQSFLQHAIALHVSKHFKKVDLSASLGGYSKFTDYSYKGLQTSLDLTYHVTPRLSVGFNGSIKYAQNWIPSPAYSTEASFQTLTNGNKDAFNYNTSVTLKFTLGNTRIKSRDRRWSE